MDSTRSFIESRSILGPSMILQEMPADSVPKLATDQSCIRFPEVKDLSALTVQFFPTIFKLTERIFSTWTKVRKGWSKAFERFVSGNSFELHAFLDGQKGLATHYAASNSPNQYDIFVVCKHSKIVIIFDYDDTLLCTSFLAPNGFGGVEREVDPQTKKHLKENERLVVRFRFSPVCTQPPKIRLNC